MNTTEEYGLHPPPSQNGNGHALTPSEKAWQTARDRAVAETRKTPYDLRRQVWRCREKTLNAFARLLFARLTDMAFEPEFRRGDGMLEVSKKFLADEVGCSVDRVTRAARVLESTGFLWTKTFWTGHFEITRWFLREWADDQAEFPFHSGANFGRSRSGVQRNTARGGNGKFAANPNSFRSKLRDLLARGGLSEADAATVKAIISPDHGEESALTGQTSKPCQGLKLHPDHGEESALTGQENLPCQGAGISPDRAEKSALTGQKNLPGQGAKMPGLTTLRDGDQLREKEPLKRSTVLNAQRSGDGKGRTASREKIFLLDVAAMMDRWRKGSSKAELTNSGAWWRLAFRADAGLMERVLADTLAQVKEGGIKQSPGQHAVDLWNRWGGKLEARP